MAEKRTVGAEEIEWAREYERSQLRPWARFAPFSGGGPCLIRKGTRIRVSVPPFDQEPVGVYAAPLDAGLEKAIVPEDERKSAKYGGFSLFVKTDQLNKNFKPVRRFHSGR